MFSFIIPLNNKKDVVTMFVPFPMSEEDFAQLEATLQLWKPALIAAKLDYTKCPECGGPTEFNREVPPAAYVCDKCSPNPEEK